jgi:hypothetical protein
MRKQGSKREGGTTEGDDERTAPEQQPEKAPQKRRTDYPGPRAPRAPEKDTEPRRRGPPDGGR